MRPQDNRGNSPEIPTMREDAVIRATYPEIIAKALMAWDAAKLEKEKIEAELFADFRLSDPKASVAEIQAKIHASQKRLDAATNEIIKKSDYYAKKRTYETAMR